jgi:CDP-diacylglycerol---glycerol-3-phosphate 3-phosphatidyltransferase
MTSRDADTMADLICSLLLVGAVAVVAACYAFRVAFVGAAHFDRVEREGRSLLVGKATMEMGYWALQPLGRSCVAAGITANMISWSALALAFGAGFAVAGGRMGLAAVLASVSSLCDVLDGLVARRSRAVSGAGSVLDSSIDRYAEFFFLGGLAVHYRAELGPLLLALAALAGSFMVSYATAKAEALRVAAPRGAMRRLERAVCLSAGAALTPLAAMIFPRSTVLGLREVPMLVALAAVAVLSNASAVRRLWSVAHAAPAASGAGDGR